MQGVAFDARASGTILQDMWDKWVFLATLAGITCLMRAAVGDIMQAAGGREATLALLDACRSVAEHAGHAPHESVLAKARGVLTEQGSTLTASMLRDLESGKAVEADHVVGDMLARGAGDADLTPLHTAYAHLKAYEARRDRMAKG
jgi:2-dehydropantoate 2-reductase